MNSLISSVHLNRFMSMAVFAMAFIVIGTTIPRFYLQYIDKTEYVRIVEPISFNSKIYTPCAEATALIKFQSLIASPAFTRYQLKLIDSNTFKVVYQNEMESFVTPTQGVEPLVYDFQIPCGLVEGDYFFAGIITYRVSGIEKNYAFTTGQFKVITEVPEALAPIVEMPKDDKELKNVVE